MKSICPETVETILNLIVYYAGWVAWVLSDRKDIELVFASHFISTTCMLNGRKVIT